MINKKKRSFPAHDMLAPPDSACGSYRWPARQSGRLRTHAGGAGQRVGATSWSSPSPHAEEVNAVCGARFTDGRWVSSRGSSNLGLRLFLICSFLREFGPPYFTNFFRESDGLLSDHPSPLELAPPVPSVAMRCQGRNSTWGINVHSD
jgi:hypothetical protein